MRRVLYTKPLWSGFFKVVNATLLMASGKAVIRDVVVNRNSAAVLLINTDRQTALMVKQYRPGPMLNGDEFPLHEIPAGMVERYESPRVAALRETEEEVGIRPYFFEKLGEAYLSPGTSTEVCTLYYGLWTDANRVGAGGGLASEGEEIEMVEINTCDLWEPRYLRDMKTVAAINLLRYKSGPGYFLPVVTNELDTEKPGG